LFVVYQKSESSERMKYQVILDLVEGKFLLGGLSVGSDTHSRKRPESSSPEKLKARNKDKFTASNEDVKAKNSLKIKKPVKGSDDNDDDNYEEEFEKLLDKDDESES
jgi:hypothetical protein